MRLVDRLDSWKLAIFLFHGVIARRTTRVRNYTGKHLLREDFLAALRGLKEAGAPLGIDEALELCLSGRPFPERAFVVSFDDGFENNASVAAPLLDELGLPAVFYVSTAFVDEGRMSWIDRVEHAFEALEHVRVGLPWRSAPAAAWDDAGKIALLKEIRHEAKRRPGVDPEALADGIVGELGVGQAPGDHPLDRKLSWEQVRQLHSHPLFTVGGHTHTHAIMSRLSPAELEREVDVSLALLREKAGVGPRHYSYPEGQAEHFSPLVAALLKSRGVLCCPTAMDGLNPPGTDPFLLKRIMVDGPCAA